MTVQHSTLTGSALHEPKGASTAGSGQVYIANGSGSGTWTSLNNANKVVLNLHFMDLSAVGSTYVVSPIAGTISSIHSVIDQAIATADTTLTAKIGGVNVTNGVITIAFSGSAAGDVDSATPTAANTVTAGQAIEIACGGETNTSGAEAHVSILVDVS